MRRVILLATLLLAVGAALYFRPAITRRIDRRPGAGEASSPRSSSRPPAEKSSRASAVATGSPARSAADAAAPYADADFPLAARLNAPDSTAARDLDLLRQIFEAWQSNFPHDGNPVGENAEITAALMGDNALDLALIPKGHRAVNARGELCDRWGTPLRFHQLSGTRMEIRSAGPDRIFATEDDLVWTPQ